VILGGDHAGVLGTLYRKSDTGDWRALPESRVHAAARRVAEVRIPFEVLGVRTGSDVALFVLLTREGAEIERHPRHQAIEFQVPDERFPARAWTA
jgi:hypothetical protein